MVTTTRRRPHLETTLPLDNAPQAATWVSSLEPGKTHNMEGTAETGEFATNGSSSGNSLDRTSSDSSLNENYDDRKLDTAALMQGSRGGQVEVDLTDSGHLLARRSSIPIRLEKTEKQGRYMLHADDPEVREIIRRGLERQEISSSSKTQRNRIRELVFTRRFTTFDRQNPSNTESPFHGFFTLFWLAMAFLLVRVAVNNARSGSILGNNELLRMMFGREMFALGLTDGAMCGATVFGLLLQRLILNDIMSWNTSGWIVSTFFNRPDFATHALYS